MGFKTIAPLMAFNTSGRGRDISHASVGNSKIYAYIICFIVAKNGCAWNLKILNSWQGNARNFRTLNEVVLKRGNMLPQHIEKGLPQVGPRNHSL
jgi:hypothetical protein